MQAKTKVCTIASCLLILAAAGGCLTTLTDYQIARKELEACLARHPNEPNACAAERALVDERYRDYEEEAERAWGCENTPDRCAAPSGVLE